MLGLTNNTGHVIRRTLPTSFNTWGKYRRHGRPDHPRKPGLSSFGFRVILFNKKCIPLQDYETYLISEIVHMWPDPQAATSPLIARGPEVATIRITPQNDPSEWKIIRDYRDKSVLKGLSLVCNSSLINLTMIIILCIHQV